MVSRSLCNGLGIGITITPRTNHKQRWTGDDRALRLEVKVLKSRRLRRTGVLFSSDGRIERKFTTRRRRAVGRGLALINVRTVFFSFEPGRSHLSHLRKLAALGRNDRLTNRLTIFVGPLQVILFSMLNIKRKLDE